MPRSPRATMMPSAASRISSKLAKPSWFSTLAMMRMPVGTLEPHSRLLALGGGGASRAAAASTARISAMSDALRTNDAAMKSTLFLTPQFTRSSVSFSVSVGRSTITPGKLQFLRSPSFALFRQRHCTRPPFRSIPITCRRARVRRRRSSAPTAAWQSCAHLEQDRAIRHQDLVAHLHVARDVLVADAHHLRRAHVIIVGGQPYGIALLQSNGLAIRQHAGSDLWPW